MTASEQLVRIGEGRMLHLLASYLFRQPPPSLGIHGRASCGVKGRLTFRADMRPPELGALVACPRCTATAETAARFLRDHDRIFQGRRADG